MHSPRILKPTEEEILAYDFQFGCEEEMSCCPHSPDESPMPFPDSSPQHSESSDEGYDSPNDRLPFVPVKEDFESIASILVALRSAPVIKPKENIFVFSEPKEDVQLVAHSDSGSESELEVEVDCDDEWNERLDGTESKGYITKGSGGFACEKHKRWKKRCPSWCPMRKENYKKNGVKVPSEPPMESPNSSGSEGSSRRKRSYAKISSPSTTPEYLTVSESPMRVSPVNTIACQFHAQLHARCPLNCPDRRIKTNVRKKQKKIEDMDLARRATF
jgi:hypothetical protein